jgi:hypothetical protein
MTIRAHFDGVHTPDVRTHLRPAHRGQSHSRFRQDVRRISGAVAANNYSPLRTTDARQPRPSRQTIRQCVHGRMVVHPCGQHLNAHGHAIWSADQMQTLPKELLPFRRTIPAAFASARLPAGLGAYPAAHRQGKASDDDVWAQHRCALT